MRLRCTQRVAHVVQAVERRDQVEAVLVELLRARYLEAHPVADACITRASAGGLDRSGVVVRADERAGRECLCHQQCRRAVPAADVSHPEPALELGRDAVQRGDPLGQQVHQVAGAEEPLASGEHVLVVLVPANAGAGTECLLDLVLRLQRSERELEGPGEEHRPLRVGQCERLLSGHRVRLGARVVLDVPARGLSAQPLVDVSRVGPGGLGEGARVARSLGEGSVETQPLAEQHVAGAHGGTEVADELPHERHQGVHVDRRRGCFFDRGHLSDRGHLPPCQRIPGGC